MLFRSDSFERNEGAQDEDEVPGETADRVPNTHREALGEESANDQAMDEAGNKIRGHQYRHEDDQASGCDGRPADTKEPVVEKVLHFSKSVQDRCRNSERSRSEVKVRGGPFMSDLT